MVFKAIILAGGNGERFWPLSTPERPKQFLGIFGGESLIAQTVRRFEQLTDHANIHVITSRRHVALTRRELPDVPAANIVGEPMRRDTAAAVALGLARAGGASDDVLGFFPSDQLVGDVPAFRRVVKKAIALARKSSSIVTIGISPTGPATQFGYVDPESGRFVEKPDARRAREYLRRGYLWNAGMFIARAEVFRAAFAEHAPELVDLKLSDYARIPRISFDYAIMEKVAQVKVVAGDFGWDDAGGYNALMNHFKPDESGNVIIGDVRAVDSDACIMVAGGAKIVTLGVKDLVVATAGDTVFVAGRPAIAKMKKLFE